MKCISLFQITPPIGTLRFITSVPISKKIGDAPLSSMVLSMSFLDTEVLDFRNFQHIQESVCLRFEDPL